MRIIWLVIVLALPCVGQTFPGLQFVKPETDGGSPLLVATPCATPSNFGGEMTWVKPIMVYEDSLSALYVDHSCITAAVQMGFAQTGKYTVAMYSYYKSSEYPCKVLLDAQLASMTEADRREFQSKYATEYQRECKLMGYRVRWIDVDTRSKKIMITRRILVDIKGFHMLDEKVAKDWLQLSEMEKDPLSRGTVAATERTTKLIEKELEYWNRRYGPK